MSKSPPYFWQKLSWNLINKFPHTSFFWKGLDGTRILTHFPPADNYNCQVSVKEAMMSISNHKDVERSNQSLLLFGNGDGGGGPNADMLYRAKRFLLFREFTKDLKKHARLPKYSGLKTWMAYPKWKCEIPQYFLNKLKNLTAIIWLHGREKLESINYTSLQIPYLYFAAKIKI